MRSPRNLDVVHVPQPRYHHPIVQQQRRSGCKGVRRQQKHQDIARKNRSNVVQWFVEDVNYGTCPQKAAWCDDQADKELHIETPQVRISMAAVGVAAQAEYWAGAELR